MSRVLCLAVALFGFVALAFAATCDNCPSGDPGINTYSCTIDSCAMNRADCNMMIADGCEVHTDSDTMNCGSCSNVCPTPTNAAATCSMSTCGYTCTAPYNDCNMMSTDGCESNSNTDVNNCGSCSNMCSVGTNVASASCTSGTCGIGSCSSGYKDCNMLSGDGCEINTMTDTSNCGMCGTMCPTPTNAMATCSASTCGYSCTGNYQDCDMMSSNGCESDKTSDSANCGSCGNSCSGAAHVDSSMCMSSACKITMCSRGYFDCDGTFSTGCEHLASTTTTTHLNIYEYAAKVVAPFTDKSTGNAGTTTSVVRLGSYSYMWTPTANTLIKFACNATSPGCIDTSVYPSLGMYATTRSANPSGDAITINLYQGTTLALSTPLNPLYFSGNAWQWTQISLVAGIPTGKFDAITFTSTSTQTTLYLSQVQLNTRNVCA